MSQYQKKTFTYTYLDHQPSFYQLPPSTTIHSILPVQFTCLTVFLRFSSGPFWSTSWSGILYFIFCTFLHPSLMKTNEIKQWCKVKYAVSVGETSEKNSSISFSLNAVFAISEEMWMVKPSYNQVCWFLTGCWLTVVDLLYIKRLLIL